MHHLLTQTFLLQDNAGSITDLLLMAGPIVLIVYFILIRPQNKERRQQQTMRSALKKGDRVLTQGGVVANIRDVKEKEVVLDLDGAKMRVVRDAVIRVLEAKEAKTADA